MIHSMLVLSDKNSFHPNYNFHAYMNNFVITDVINQFFVINKIVRDSYFNF